MKFTKIFLITLFISSCASMTEEGSKVRFASEVGSNCIFLGSVDGSIWVNNGDNHLKNKAARMGGNWIVVTSHRWEGVFTGDKPSSGEVYKCPESTGSAKILSKRVDLNIKQENPQSANTNNIAERLKNLKELYKSGAITKEDYEKKKSLIIDEL